VGEASLLGRRVLLGFANSLARTEGVDKKWLYRRLSTVAGISLLLLTPRGLQAEEKGDHSKAPVSKKQPLDCSKGFFSLRTPPKECGKSREVELAVLPAVFVQKETGFGAVVYTQMSFYTDSEPETDASRMGLSLTYTSNQQFIARMPTFLNFKNNNWVIEGASDFRIYPNRYYGVGNDSLWDYQSYSENVLSFDYEVRRRVYGPLYIGLLWDMRAAFKFSAQQSYDIEGEETDAEGVLDREDPTGNGPNFNHGMGIQAVYDKRDNFNYPRSGGYHRTSLTYYSPVLGGEHKYPFWVIDARQYIPVFGTHVLAFQFLSEVRWGDVPFSSMAELGGPWQMRGYFRGRYRDDNLALLQFEYRYPIYRRLSGVAFASLGEVYGKKNAFDWGLLRWTTGAGARFRFGEHTYVRLDAAFNTKTRAIIFNGGQAF